MAFSRSFLRAPGLPLLTVPALTCVSQQVDASRITSEPSITSEPPSIVPISPWCGRQANAAGRASPGKAPPGDPPCPIVRRDQSQAKHSAGRRCFGWRNSPSRHSPSRCLSGTAAGGGRDCQPCPSVEARRAPTWRGHERPYSMTISSRRCASRSAASASAGVSARANMKPR